MQTLWIDRAILVAARTLKHWLSKQFHFHELTTLAGTQSRRNSKSLSQVRLWTEDLIYVLFAQSFGPTAPTYCGRPKCWNSLRTESQQKAVQKQTCAHVSVLANGDFKNGKMWRELTFFINSYQRKSSVCHFTLGFRIRRERRYLRWMSLLSVRWMSLLVLT